MEYLLKMVWRVGISRPDWSGGTDWDRALRADGGRGWAAGTGSPPLTLGKATGDEKWWIATTVLVMQGRRVVVSEQQKNTNRLHKNWN